MKKTIWTFLGTLMAASLFAQNNPNALPPVPAPVNSPAAETAPPAATPPPNTPTGTPRVKHIKKHHALKHRVAVKEPTVMLAPGPAQVNASDLTVRGQAGLKGEAVAHLHKGDTVNVLEQINIGRHAAGEPSQWAKISYPKAGHVWVMARYVENGAVSVKKLNLRSGPGENYSVVGVIDQGAAVNQVERKGSWIEIEPPANAYAFVAARYLTQEAVPTRVATAPETPEIPAPTPVPQPQPMITAPQPPPQPAQPTVRIVQHEGVIGPVTSPIAPTAYELYDPDTKADIDFLFPTSPDQDLHKLVDDQVIVTGEEGVDSRFPNTPVIAIQSIQILGKHVIKRLDLTPPRMRH